jgi:hypothetical protein
MDKTKKKEVSQDFASLFLTNMFENMFESLENDGPFGSYGHHSKGRHGGIREIGCRQGRDRHCRPG